MQLDGKNMLRNNIAGILFGIGLAFGIVPIALASVLIKKNLFNECISRMDEFWKQLEHDDIEKE